MKAVSTFFLVLLGLAKLAFGGDLVLNKEPGKSSVDFFKEEITLSVNDSEATINGVYYFRNDTEKNGEFPVLFPFYVDSLTLFPYSIKAYVIDNAKTVKLNYRIIEKARSISMTIPIKAHSITTWYLDYSQIIKASKARYIITSTSAWGKPLEKATYKFIVPSNFDNITAWPQPDTALIDKSNTILISHQTNFLPRRDMEVTWTKK